MTTIKTKAKKGQHCIINPTLKTLDNAMKTGNRIIGKIIGRVNSKYVIELPNQFTLYKRRGEFRIYGQDTLIIH